MRYLALTHNYIGRINRVADNLGEVCRDLHRHGFINYVNNGSLPQSYFDTAYQSLNDPYVYIVLSNTGSAASELISVFTRKQFNHVSLAFDKDLATVISYNSGEKVYPPGLNHEEASWFNKKQGASLIIYRLEVSLWQKSQMIEKVRQINREGSAYNILGLFIRRSLRPNIMFCSQFVYCLLRSAGANYFEKKAGQVRPMDFVELDYQHRLMYEGEIVFS